MDEEQGEEIVFPTSCPACGSILEQRGAHIFCNNKLGCQPQLIGRITHFRISDAMDIESFSIMTAEQLYTDCNVKDPADLYRLTFDDLIQLDRFGEKKANKLLEAIEKSKERELASFLYALGISNTGKATAKTLAEHYRSLEAVMNATIDELVQLQDVGSIVAESIVSFFQDETAKLSIASMIEAGVKAEMEESVVVASEDNPFFGKTIVITGAFPTLSRDELSKRLEACGAKVTLVSPKRQISLLLEKKRVVNPEAQDLGIQILDDETVVLEMLSN